MAETTTIAAASGASGATSLGPASASHPSGNAHANDDVNVHKNANANEKGHPPSRHRSRGRGRGEGNGRGGRGGGGNGSSSSGRGHRRGRGGRRGRSGRGGRGDKNDGGSNHGNDDDNHDDANVNGTGSGEAAENNGAETSGTSADDGNGNRGNRGTRRNRRGGGRRSSNNDNHSNNNGSREASEEHARQFIADSLPPIPSDSAADNNSNSNNNHENSAENNAGKQPPTSQKHIQKQTKRRRNKQKQKYTWRKFIPEGAVDPISLDPLDELPYPPFALVVDEPYVPVFPGEWPPLPVNGDGKEESTAAASTGTGTGTGNAMAVSGSDGEGVSSRRKQQETEEERKKREMEILKQQWGESATSTTYLTWLSKKKEPSEETNTSDDNNNNEDNSDTHKAKPTSNQTPPLQNRVFNLFDPHILSNYLISTLQFIDPLNRRDLTRPELQALDAHLRAYRLGKPHVVEAYDEKGVTVSAAGSRAQTTSGRAEILQQEARNILAGFFRGERPRYARGSEGHGSRPSQEPHQHQQQHQHQQGSERDDGVTNDFQRMYMAQEGRNRRRRQDNSTAVANGRDHDHGQNADTGIYGNESGLVMIDDDINPGLRSGVPSDDRNRNGSYTQSTHNNLGSLYSARHITERYSQEAQIRDTNFPSLSAAASSSANAVNSDPNATTSANTTAKKAAPPVSGPPSKSLLKITNVVKKTDPAEVARQKKAREEAQRKAAMTQLNYFDPSTANSTLLTAPTPMQRLPPSEAILERNRNLAMALGVAPSTIRNDVSLTGWARPTTVEIQLDQFGNELNTAQYPDSLLAQAKERMTELLKVEKIWKKFLADDREASCSLRPMDRPLRKFIHEYSDFWKLHTQSFDPEGKRYIHCGKLMDTAMPYPLLSEAVKKWRGPAPGSLLPPVPTQTTMQLPNQPQAKPQSQSQPQTQPANTEGWATEQRVPLKLTPRTIAEGAPPPPPSSGGMTRSSSTPFLSMTGEKPPPPRFADLHEKERPKLQLAPRTIPVEGGGAEYPQQQRELDMEAKKRELARMQRRENKAKKERANMEKKRAILESAFASDDDDDDDGGGSIGASSSSSDWFEGDAAFDASDDEGLL